MGEMGMTLSKSEFDVMDVLWVCKIPMTAAEIVAALHNSRWSENSIFVILKSLSKKGAVVLSHPKPTSTNYARTYIPALSLEEYALETIGVTIKRGKAGKNINWNTFIEGVKALAAKETKGS